MSANHYRPHVLILPEDDANRDMVIGFRRNLAMDFRQVQVEDVAGGWLELLELFESVYVREMDRRPIRRMVLSIDLDDDLGRLQGARARVPEHLSHRVFILGVLSEPERLKSRLRKSYEEIGMDLAKDCQDGTDVAWGHELLRHNAAEVERLREQVRPILFPSTESR